MLILAASELRIRKNRDYFEKFSYNVHLNKQKCVFLRKILNIMKRPLLPKHERMLRTLGENMRLARLRRDLSSEQVSERAGIARNTLIKIERGDEGVAIHYYYRSNRLPRDNL